MAVSQRSSGPHAKSLAQPQLPVVVMHLRLAPHAVVAEHAQRIDAQVLPELHCAAVVQGRQVCAVGSHMAAPQKFGELSHWG